jgi:mannose-1-phosphate guanylyltransferase
VDAIILSGGLGTRLYPLTLSKPKSLLPFLDRAIIEYQIDIACEAECERIIAASGHMADQLAQYALCSDLGVECVHEDSPLGTGGALANVIRGKGLCGPLIAINGDILCDIAPRSLMATAKSLGTSATITAAPVENASAFGTLEIDKTGILTSFKEKEAGASPAKRSMINAGIYYLDETVVESLAKIEGAFSIETDFFPALAAAGGVGVHIHNGFWRDIGTLELYFKTHFDILGYFLMMGTANFGGKRGDFALFKDFIYIHNRTTLEAGCDLYHRVVLMKGAEVGEKSMLRNCIVLPGARIGKGCKLETVLIDAGYAVPDGAVISNKVLSQAHEEPFGG